MWQNHQVIYGMFSAITYQYLADKLPLSAHEGDTVLHRQVQSSLYGLLQREIKVEPTESKRERSVSKHPGFTVMRILLVCLTSH